ncbi:MAG: hypothetical protein K2O99_06230 [Lachnospiraceae bacterium]|nr:hypothetical protein [Lachnospiraceae bacterium]
MKDELFAKLWKDALAQPDRDMYIAEYGYPNWFDEISPDMEKVVETLVNIHTVAHMSFKDIISASGLTQVQFSYKFCIPKRTVENWSSGSRKCPDHNRLMFARFLGLLK